jgi:hypothetical protein
MIEKTPENFCPICGGSKVIGAYSKPGPRGQWLWACRKCSKAWTKEQWGETVEWCKSRGVEFMDQAEGQMKLTGAVSTEGE